jgi:hypothetical protein
MSQLALLGGPKTKTKAFPAWPLAFDLLLFIPFSFYRV